MRVDWSMIMGSTWMMRQVNTCFFLQTLGRENYKYDGGCFMDLNVAHLRLGWMRKSLHFELMDFTHMDDVVGIDETD